MIKEMTHMSGTAHKCEVHQVVSSNYHVSKLQVCVPIICQQLILTHFLEVILTVDGSFFKELNH